MLTMHMLQSKKLKPFYATLLFKLLGFTFPSIFCCAIIQYGTIIYFIIIL